MSYHVPPAKISNSITTVADWPLLVNMRIEQMFFPPRIFFLCLFGANIHGPPSFLLRFGNQGNHSNFGVNMEKIAQA